MPRSATPARSSRSRRAAPRLATFSGASWAERRSNTGGAREAPTPSRIAVHQVDQRGRSARGRDQRVQLVLGHHGVDPLGAREQMILVERAQVVLVGERSLGLRLNEDLLPEV